MKFPTVEWLIDGVGEITIGSIGPIRCAATACDEHQQLAMLVRRPGESIEALLRRLEAALVRAYEHDEFIGEINGDTLAHTDEEPDEHVAPPPEVPRYTSRQGQYLAFIYYFSKIHGVPPAEADLQRYFRVSPAAVHRMIVALEDRGVIERNPGRARSIRVVLDREEIPGLE
ncbi:MAG: LexA family protein [Candidatus Binatia bacterium]